MSFYTGTYVTKDEEDVPCVYIYGPDKRVFCVYYGDHLCNSSMTNKLLFEEAKNISDHLNLYYKSDEVKNRKFLFFYDTNILEDKNGKLTMIWGESGEVTGRVCHFYGERYDNSSKYILNDAHYFVQCLTYNTPECLLKRKKIEFEINKEIVFSLSHISDRCNQDLELAQKGDYNYIPDFFSQLTIYDNDGYGYRILIDNDVPKSTGFPEFDEILDLAKKKGVKWLLLDSDGPIYPNFPTFDW